MGELTTTRAIHSDIKDNPQFEKEIDAALLSYQNCDWGDLEQADKEANTRALDSNLRILAAYKTSNGKVYIITEWDRSYTTIMYAREY